MTFCFLSVLNVSYFVYERVKMKQHVGTVNWIIVVITVIIKKEEIEKIKIKF